MVGQKYSYLGIYGVYTVFLAGESPYIRPYTVQIYGSGQPYIRRMYTELASPAHDLSKVQQNKPNSLSCCSFSSTSSALTAAAALSSGLCFITVGEGLGWARERARPRRRVTCTKNTRHVLLNVYARP